MKYRYVELKKNADVVVAIVVVYPGKVSVNQSGKLLYPPQQCIEPFRLLTEACLGVNCQLNKKISRQTGF